MTTIRRRFSFGLLLVVLVAPELQARLERAFEWKCAGLEAYRITGTYNVDWGWGELRAKSDAFELAFYVGPMAEVLIPARRPPGFRWLKTERFGDVIVRYGLNVRAKQMQATIVGGTAWSELNIAGDPKDKDRFIAVTRLLATADCRSVSGEYKFTPPRP